MTINFTTFYTEGQPHDHGKNLSHLESPTRDSLKNEFDNVYFYTPRIVKNLISAQYVNPVPRSGKWGNVGNQAWKPAIILNEMDKLDEGDIIVYRDIDYGKYPSYKKVKNLRTRCQEWLKKCSFDFFIPAEISLPEDWPYNWAHESSFLETLRLDRWCKEYTIYNLAENFSFAANYSQCVVNLLVFKKTKISIDFLSEWLEHCSNQKYLDGNHFGHISISLQAHCPEQAVANIILCNWICTRKHNISNTYPEFGFGLGCCGAKPVGKKCRDIDLPISVIRGPGHFELLRNKK